MNNKTEKKSSPVRLQKWLAQIGIASRREAEKLILEKKIYVNDHLATLGMSIDPEQDAIRCKGKLLEKQAPQKTYMILHKPDKTLVSLKSQGGKQTIYDLTSLKKFKNKLHAVGRLDYRSEGLLLLTNDGDLSFRLMHPSFHVEKTYAVLLDQKLSREILAKIAQGVPLDDKRAFAKVKPQNRENWYEVRVQEGRNRLVRRIFAFYNFEVLRLIRTHIGGLALPSDLSPGKLRELESHEIKMLKKTAQLPEI